MYICPNCKRTSETPMNFCVGCGTPMVEQVPIQQPQYQPVSQQPQYEQPQYQPAPQQPQYEQPQYQSAPQQPQYEQPQYQPAPQQPQYEQPQYQPAPQQPQYEQPQYQPAPQQPHYEQPAYQQVPQQPQYNPSTYQNVSAAPSKAKSIIGMVLSIIGLVMSFVCFITYFSNLDYNGGAYAFGYAIGFSIFSFPAALVGLIMSNSNRNAGDTSAMSKVGKILGLIGVILSGATLFIALCCIGA